MLIDERSDRVIKNALDRFAAENNAEAIRDATINCELAVRTFAINEEDFNTIKVQLLALKLIMRSRKRQARSVSDRNAYWMLTPYGEALMVSLRAIKRPGDPTGRCSRLRTAAADFRLVLCIGNCQFSGKFFSSIGVPVTS